MEILDSENNFATEKSATSKLNATIGAIDGIELTASLALNLQKAVEIMDARCQIQVTLIMIRNYLKSDPSVSGWLQRSRYKKIGVLLMIILVCPLFALGHPVSKTQNVADFLKTGKITRDFSIRKDTKSIYNIDKVSSCIPTISQIAPTEGSMIDALIEDNADDISRKKVKVALRFGEDVEAFYNTIIKIFNKDYQDIFSVYTNQLDSDLSYTFNVPEGIYSIFVYYEVRFKDGKNRTECIAHDNIEVYEDIENIVNNEEANHLILLKKYLPDGKRVVLPTVRELDDEPWYEYDYSDATAYSLFGFQDLYNTEGGYMVGTILIADSYREKGEEDYGIWVSPMSEKYVFSESILVDGIDDTVSVISETTKMTQSLLESTEFNFANNPVNYREMEKLGVHHLPSWYELTEEERKLGWAISTWIDSYNMGSLEVAYLPGTDFKVCMPTSKDETLPIQLAFYQRVVEGHYRFYEWEEEYTPTYLVSLPKILIDGEWTYINNNHDMGGNYACHYPEGYYPNSMGNMQPLSELPGHPEFSFSSNDCQMELGNSCPIMYTCATWDRLGIEYFEDGGMDWLWGYGMPTTYIGRLGEVHNMSGFDLNMSLKVDGEEQVLEDAWINNPYNWIKVRELDKNKVPGEVELSVVNNNVTVDDIIGKNHTIFTYDERKEERSLPTLTMLMFKNKNGQVTDRFLTPDDGIIEFSAGDFYWYENWFRCLPLTVDLEYAPYGSEEFKSLEFKEIPELYRMPNFGYFYTGSLKDIDMPSDNGWYTLRFSLKDDNGGTQMQLIEPAFYIHNVTSDVNTISTCSGQVDVFRIDGTFVESVTTTEDCYKLPSGIYILRSRTEMGMTPKKILVP